MPGIVSITDSSNTDCALSVTGPYESTAMVTGPMPRNPKATRPNANTAGASIMPPAVGFAALMAGICPLTIYAMAMSAMIARPIQYALKLPATRPDRMLSDGPPSFDDVTTSRVCADSVDVNTLTNSGMIAPASVPQVIISDSFHHIVLSPPRVGIRN